MKTRLHKNLHMNVYLCFIHICPKQETIQMSLSWWMEDLLSSSEKEYCLAARRDRLLHKCGWILHKLRSTKQAQLKELHSVWVYMTFWRRQNSKDWKKSVISKSWGWRKNRPREGMRESGGWGNCPRSLLPWKAQASHPLAIWRQTVEVWIWGREPNNYHRCILRAHSFICQMFFEAQILSQARLLSWRSWNQTRKHKAS